MKRSIRYVMLAFVLLALIPAAVSVSEGVTWQDAYRDFVFNQDYLKSGNIYRRPDVDYSYEEIRFALHDMNHDGMPELLTTNSDYTHAEAETYVYALREGKVKSIGDWGMGSIDSLWYYPESAEYSAIFSGYGQMGIGIIIYYTVDQDTLKRVDVASVDFGGRTVQYVPLTHDDSLLELYRSHGETSEIMNGTPLTTVTDSDLRAMGWDAFLALYGFSQETVTVEGAIENPLIEPAEGDIISLWEQEEIMVRWRRVEGAKSYQIEIRCAWFGTEMQNLKKTLYLTTLQADSLSDQEEYALAIPLSVMDVSSVPHYADLEATVTLKIVR